MKSFLAIIAIFSVQFWLDYVDRGECYPSFKACNGAGW